MTVKAGVVVGSLGVVPCTALVISLVAPAFSPGGGLAGTSSRLTGPGTMGRHAHMLAGDVSGMHADNEGRGSLPIAGAREFRVEAANFSFVPNEIRLVADALNLTFTNPVTTGVVHDLVVPGLEIHITAYPGETKTIGLSGLAPGRYDAYCAVPGHLEMGMRATVIVR